MTVSLPTPDTPAEGEAYRTAPQFSVSLSKLAIMSLCTFGFYELYWCYKQWDAIRRRESEHLSPFWRAFFAPLWGFSLFPRLQKLMAKHSVPANWSGTGLALGFLVLGAASRLPDPLWLISLFSFVPLLVVQRSVNALNAAVAPGTDRNDRYSGRNVVVIVIGTILLLFAILGTILPAPEEDAQYTRQVAV
jgi:hypothetical protein